MFSQTAKVSCTCPVSLLSFPHQSCCYQTRLIPAKIPASHGTWDLEPQLRWHLMLNQCSTRALCLCHELGAANQSWIKLFHLELLTICVRERPMVRVCGQLSIGPLRQVLGEQRGSVVTLAMCCASRTPAHKLRARGWISPMTQSQPIWRLAAPTASLIINSKWFFSPENYLLNYLSIKQIRKRCHAAAKLQPWFTKKSIPQNLTCQLAPELFSLRRKGGW